MLEVKQKRFLLSTKKNASKMNNKKKNIIVLKWRTLTDNTLHYWFERQQWPVENDSMD